MATKVQCTFAGVPFRNASADVLERLERYDYARLNEIASPYDSGWPGANLARLGLPKFKVPIVKVGQFFYPAVGASRWGVFRGLMTQTDIDAVKKIVWPSTSATGTTGTFKLYQPVDNDTSTATALEGPMYMLPPFPVTGADGDNKLYIVTLVDERYFWQWKSVTTVFDVTGMTSNPAFIDQVEYIQWVLNSIGISIPGGVGEAGNGFPQFFDPDSPLYCHYESAPALLDAAFLQTGRAFKRKFDGTYSQDFLRGIYHTYQKNYLVARESGTSQRIIGAVIGPSSIVSPSLTTLDAYRAMIPQQVTVTFPWWLVDEQRYKEPTAGRERCRSDSYGKVYAVTVNSVDILGSTFNYFAGSQTMRTSLKARFANDAATSPSNATNLGVYATSLATEYLYTKLSYIDEIYPGVCTSFFGYQFGDWFIQWDGKDCYTRVTTPPYNLDHVMEFFHSGGDFDDYLTRHRVAYTAAETRDTIGAALTDSATIDFTYTDAPPNETITAIVIDNSISNAKIRQGGACSVVGRSANSLGNVADISASVNGQVLQRKEVSPGVDAIVFDTAPSSSSITVGTTTISGGTNGNFVYDNAGVVGELTPASADSSLGTAAGAIADGTYGGP